MQAIEIITIILAILIVGTVCAVQIINKINGKCGCGCEDCPHSVTCSNVKKERRENMAKYLKCEGCGAIVKVIKDCNCKDCGITCCGKQMTEYVPKEGEDLTGKGILTCDKCGASVEVIKPCNCENCGIKCCGEQMK